MSESTKPALPGELREIVVRATGWLLGGTGILPRPSDDTLQGGTVAGPEPIFTVTDRWGNEIVLTQEDWDRIVAKRPGVENYVEEVRQTLEGPTLDEPGAVYEGGYIDTKVFYKKGLLDEDPLYKACYVCVVVRYKPSNPASLRTVYFPFNMQGKLGNVLYWVL